MMVHKDPEDQAIRAVCSQYFHQALWLPETATHQRLKVTFSTTTNFDDGSLPAVLFVGPMLGTRWLALIFDKLSRDCGVRVICVDSPGFGGSTPVSMNIRMAVWLDIVPALLKKLDVEYVALVTHSAGTVYTLNTLVHHRSLLDPKAPYVAFLAPWVPVPHSAATLTTLASKLPSNILDGWAGLTTFINTKVVPGASWSGGIFSAAANVFSPSVSTDVPGVDATANPLDKQYGVDSETAKFIDSYSRKFQFAEANEGANEEVKLCLRKCGDADWGAAIEYPECMGKIADAEAAEAELRNLDEDGGANKAKLKVEAFFAGSDIMIGKKGQAYFEECWRSEQVQGKVEFGTETFLKTDHDSVLTDYEAGALRVVLERIARLGKAEHAK